MTSIRCPFSRRLSDEQLRVICLLGAAPKPTIGPGTGKRGVLVSTRRALVARELVLVLCECRRPISNLPDELCPHDSCNGSCDEHMAAFEANEWQWKKTIPLESMELTTLGREIYTAIIDANGLPPAEVLQ